MKENSADETRHNDMPIIKSDSLAELRPIFEGYSEFGIISEIFQVTVIVDANVIIGDLIWLTNKRKNPNARTNLQEVIASKTLIATAPTWLNDEIIENIPEVSEKMNIPKQDLHRAWLEYRCMIEFRDETINDTLDPSEQVPDPDDYVYLKLQKKTGFPIYSNDPHFNQMDASLINSKAIVNLRDYSRHEAVELTFLYGQSVVAGIGIKIIKLAWNVLKNLFTAFSNLPKWMKYAVILVFLGAILHPKTKQTIVHFFQSHSKDSSSKFEVLMEKITPLMERFNKAQEESDQILSSLKRQIPNINK